MQYLIAFCRRNETTTGVISGTFVWPVVCDQHVALRDLRLHRSREIPPEAVGGGSSSFLFRDNFGPEVDSDFMSGVDVEHVGLDVDIVIRLVRSKVVGVENRWCHWLGLYVLRDNFRPFKIRQNGQFEEIGANADQVRDARVNNASCIVNLTLLTYRGGRSVGKHSHGGSIEFTL